jgi:hypothetical protein
VTGQALKRQRIGRSIGSGMGKTKTAAARAKPRAPACIKGFEGGPMPLHLGR